ncbi:PAS domain S-box-containing protein/diguanylate cyclase (GGDEF) domain-containing protein [Alteromonadaceae bacterium Bs31]|nr:PAS domain S-box-containing protein/diguanylate cyclase (GGDEF) domain-containing protein [Alteromonadaceae bacterium Bs31]
MLNRKARILVVEDELIVARDIEMELRNLGYEVLGHCTSGEEAIDIARNQTLDLILMDIQLAGEMDGIDAAQIFRTQFSIPVVFISAFDADELLARAKLTEPYGYIVKPFSERELRTVLAMAIYKHHAEMQQKEAALHLQAIIDNMLDSLVTIDAEGKIKSINQAAAEVFGYGVDDVIGKKISHLLPDCIASAEDLYLQHGREEEEERAIGIPRDLQGRRKDGCSFPVTLSVSKIFRSERTTYICVIRDITERREHEKEINLLAFYDSLTQLPNRRLILDRLHQAILTATRSGRYSALMFLDLDHFKLLNDSLGHTVGDELLRQVASRLQSCLRQGDSVARLGGDEFVVLIEGLSKSAIDAAAQSESLASKILAALGQPYTLRNELYLSTASIGIVLFSNDRDSVETLIKNADTAMYQAKKSGRNTLRFFDPKMHAVAIERSSLEQSLRAALEAGEFVLHYQVQVNARGETTGVEALIRWSNPKLGLVPPASFIGLAEETGMILPIGQWVLETACAQLTAWSKTPERAHWTMAVNVSVSQFSSSKFIRSVDRALRVTHANPHLLKLEITESMMAEDLDSVVQKMYDLKKRGISFSLDDFGTGFSSLTHLKLLPLDQLKIDQSFVRDLMTDKNDVVIAKTVIALGQTLGLEVIAEGVETVEQRNFLQDIGCKAFQGYCFGKPMAIGELEAVY